MSHFSENSGSNSPSTRHRRTLDQAEQKWLQERWYKIDQSGDGMLDVQEVGLFMDSLRSGMSESEKMSAFRDIDADGTGSVEFHEFYDWYSMQDAERFKGIMFSGARHELLAAVVAIGVGLTLPWLGIAFATGMHSDPAGFFAVFLLTAITTSGLVLACFYDAYGPVIEAQRQAAQQKAFNIAITVGQASVDVALAASAPKEALKTIQRTKDGKASPRQTHYKMSNPLEPDSDLSVGGDQMFETD